MTSESLQNETLRYLAVIQLVARTDNGFKRCLGSETRTYSYDGLSRMTSEVPAETSPYATSYYYTTAGGALCAGDPNAVCRKTDPRSITTTYSYDAINRLTGKTYSNGDPAVSYFYDQTSYNGLTITNGAGRRTGMSDGSGQTAWSYDEKGQVITERRTISSVTKNTSYTYNIDGSLASITYPSGRTITYSYNAVAQPVSAVDLANSINYALNGTHAPHGALASALHGQLGGFGGITASYTYNTRLQPATIQATSSNGTVLNLTYSYQGGGSDNNDTVRSVTNSLNTDRTQSFTYDELNRLGAAQSQASSGAHCWGQSYSYDRYANLTTITVTKCSAPSLSLSINTQNRITNSGFTYDNAGNLTSDGVASFSWNAENRLVTTAGVTYTYDGDGRRVKKSNGKLYWYGVNGEELFETDLSGNLIAEYVYMGDRLVSGTLDDPHKFAGMEYESESSLYRTLYRQHSPTLGRWLSTDPERCGVDNPQGLNLYPYVMDNPTNFADPLGLQRCPPWDPFAPGCEDRNPADRCSEPFYRITHAECGWDSDHPVRDIIRDEYGWKGGMKTVGGLDCGLFGSEEPAYFGVCTYSCATSWGPAITRIRLRSIQRACPPPRPTCPLYLQVVSMVPVGSPRVVPGSCVYLGKPS